ncbi:hypothetical protein ASD24_05310 [Paenibacillus sp. Root52]|uniref:hypothetical protein n=1 Tax=Paenibacillus sp. Root52 TaxID=1736552 RepID=UPI0006F37004|nr:hypothetical protein [Paenibacillus sp. Root52]KQY87281.1 hypothetical protein ASD24_05310 [Paenibacillus sp. Root52]
MNTQPLKNKIWYYFTIVSFALLLLSSFMLEQITSQSAVEQLLGAYIIPVYVVVLVVISTIIRQRDELFNLTLIIFATYAHADYTDMLLTHWIISLALPVLFILRLIFVVKRKHKTAISIGIGAAVIYLFFYLRYTLDVI